MAGFLAGYRTVTYVAGWGGARHRAETAWLWFGAAAIVALFIWSRRADATAPSARLPVALLLGLIALAVLIYWPAITLGLLSDDFVLLSWAQRGDLAPPEWPHVRVVPLAFWRLVGWLVAPERVALVLHASNIVFHGINAFLVARLAIAIGATAVTAVAASLLFVAYPTAVEAVAWLSAMPDVLVTMLTLLTLVMATTVHRRREVSGVVIVLTSIALFTKENALVIGLLLWLTAAMVKGPTRQRVFYAGVVATAAVAAYFVWRATAGRLDVARPIDRLAIKNFFTGPFAMLGVPLHAKVSDATRGWTTAWIAVLSMAVVAAPFASQRTPALARRFGFSALWVIGAIAPAYGFFSVTEDLQGSRYLYLSTVGWTIGVASIAELVRHPRHRRALGGIFVVVLVAGALAARAHLGIWRAAAVARDDVLTAVIALPSRCDSIAIAGAPDNVYGAYVFRNGLAQALESMGRPMRIVSESEASSECHARLSGAASGTGN